MMKSIALGINIFGDFHRQKLCIDSLNRIAKKHSNVKLINIQQVGAKEPIIDPNFETVYDAGDTAGNTVPDSNTRMPMVKGFFDALASVSCDYFIFLNSDIILTGKIIRLIEENDFDSISVSHLANTLILIPPRS